MKLYIDEKEFNRMNDYASTVTSGEGILYEINNEVYKLLVATKQDDGKYELVYERVNYTH